MTKSKESEFSWYLKEVMDSQGISTGELAEATGIHPNTISAMRGWKYLKKMPSLGTLAGICRYLECQPGELMHISDLCGQSLE